MYAKVEFECGTNVRDFCEEGGEEKKSWGEAAALKDRWATVVAGGNADEAENGIARTSNHGNLDR
jgi:hypothetical protein